MTEGAASTEAEEVAEVEWNPEEDGPPNDDWIHAAYMRQAEARMLDEERWI